MNATARRPVPIDHFSDVLCVWAYCAQQRVDELRRSYGDAIAMRYHFVPVFGSTARKLGAGWADRGGFEGYANHVRGIAARFPHVMLHAETWAKVRPASSASPHVFLKAVQLIEGGNPSPAGGLFEQAAWAVRLAFFRDARDVAMLSTQMEIAEHLAIPRAELEALLGDGRAIAAFFEDVETQQAQKIEGSPTFVFNEGRQKLYGNVGYRVIDANVEELLRAPDPQAASWC